MMTTKEVQGTTVVQLGSLLDAGEGAMVTLEAGDTRLAAHRAVLASRSPVFAAMFQHYTLEASSSHVSITDMEGPVLRQLLSYCYTLQAPQLPDMASQLLSAADKYGLPALKAACEQQLAAQLDVETAAATAVLAVRHSCPSLTEAAIAFVKAHLANVVASQGWADAVLTCPEDVVQVSRLLGEPPAKSRTATTAEGGPTLGTHSQPHRDHDRHTPATAAAPTAARHTPPPEESAVSRLRSLSAKEKGRRLIQAAEEGAVKDLRDLLAAGADLQVRDRFMGTALHCAARDGHLEAVRYLVECGADLEGRNRKQSTPLHLAAWRGHADVVQLLVGYSAEPNARGDRGWTPLHFAAANGYSDVVAALLEAGSDRGARDNSGNTPLDLAMHRYQKVIDILE